MRDTQGLRTRIALLACVPGLLACSPPPRPQSASRGDGSERRDGERERRNEDQPRVGKRRKAYYARKAREEGKTVEEVTPPAQLKAEREDALRQRREENAKRREEAAKAAKVNAGNKQAMPGAEPNTVAPNVVAGDPPYIDGYNPEEEHCVSGNWCGALDAVTPVAVKAVKEEMGCPTRITGSQAADTIKGDPEVYDGLSAAPNMQGSLNQHGTDLARARTGDEAMCCYHWFEYCSGRPHLGEDGPVLAPVGPGHEWLDDAPPQAAPTVPEPLRAIIAGAWLDDARAEHASVAAFARATLELMALGAPPDLLAQAQQAGLDEIDHARRCFGLAARYGAHALQPGPLPPLGPRTASLAQLAADTFAEGCVGETIAALVAERSLRHCNDPAVEPTLRTIADDEARHAALAWSTVAWALRTGGTAVAERLRHVARSLQPAEDQPLPPADPDANALALHGRLDTRAIALAGHDAWREVIGPMLEGLLGEAASQPETTA